LQRITENKQQDSDTSIIEKCQLLFIPQAISQNFLQYPELATKLYTPLGAVLAFEYSGNREMAIAPEVIVIK